ncbi:MAG: hemerythrin domain-containing protein [Acidimicrobiia bacterium]
MTGATDATTGSASGASGGTWSELSLGALATHIDAVHHAYLRRELPRIVGLAHRAETTCIERHREAPRLAELVDTLAADLVLHTMKEERVLFPLCRYLDLVDELDAEYQGSIMGPIGCMTCEHEAASRDLEELDTLVSASTDDSDPDWTELLDALRDLVADVRLHMLKEDTGLFPRALAREGELQAGSGGHP